MVLQEDVIVDIPANRVRYFGGTGKMLLPSPATIATLIKRVPENKLVTTNLLRQKLTEQFDVQGTCPVTTQKALKAIVHEADKNIAYWRVIKQSGQLMSYFPGGTTEHAAYLMDEGFTIDTTGKVPTVKQFKESLVAFD